MQRPVVASVIHKKPKLGIFTFNTDVSGTPGTGKTLTVKKVIETLQEESCTVKQKSSKNKGKVVLTTDEYDDESQEEDSSEEESESERESPGINMVKN